jgi:hypothetical protein
MANGDLWRCTGIVKITLSQHVWYFLAPTSNQQSREVGEESRVMLCPWSHDGRRHFLMGRFSAVGALA